MTTNCINYDEVPCDIKVNLEKLGVYKQIARSIFDNIKDELDCLIRATFRRMNFVPPREEYKEVYFSLDAHQIIIDDYSVRTELLILLRAAFPDFLFETSYTFYKITKNYGPDFKLVDCGNTAKVTDSVRIDLVNERLKHMNEWMSKMSEDINDLKTFVGNRLMQRNI